MEKFIEYSLKTKVSFITCLITLPACCVLGIIFRLFPLTISVISLLCVPYLIIIQHSTLYKYKIENNSLIIKKIFKTQVYNFDELQKVFLPPKKYNNALTLTFSNKIIKIFYFDDKTMVKFFEDFFENCIEDIYNKKFQEFEQSKKTIHIDGNPLKKHDKLFGFSGFVISLLCCIDCYIERHLESSAYTFMVLAGLSAIIFLAAFFCSFKKIIHKGIEDEYIDKTGFHLNNFDIPFSQIKDLAKKLSFWGICSFIITTKDDKEYEVPMIAFNGDILYEMYISKKINIGNK